MSELPRITGNGRGIGIAKVAVLAVGQAIAAGTAAFATRDVFSALRDTLAATPFLPLGLIALAGISIAGLRIWERVVAEKVGQHYASDLRLKLFNHFSRMPIGYVDQRRQGSMALRFVGDLAAVRNWVSLGIARLISSLIVLPLATVVLFLLNPTLGLAASIPIGFGLLTMAMIAPRLGEVHRRLRSRRGGLAADMSERIPHAPELRLMGRMQVENRTLLHRTDKMIEAAIKRVKGAALLQAIPDAISGLAAASLLFAAFRSGIPAAEVAGAMAAVGLMIKPMRDLAGVGDRYRAWIAARDKCVDLLNKPRISRPKSLGSPLANEPQSVRFENVETEHLTGIDLVVEAGQKVAVMGPNGSGKSTLLALAAGLEAAIAGKVLIGEHAPSSLSSSVRKRMISFVGSKSPILAGSLRRAMTMGAAQQPSDAQILQAANSYGLRGMVERLGGLDGHVAEAGRNLSSGEVRRIMLVRAALSESRLLLLDEPDDALDVEGVGLVRQLLDGTSATTILITHNTEIARQMDLVLFVSDGRIVQCGLPEDVFDSKGPAQDFFSRLHAA